MHLGQGAADEETLEAFLERAKKTRQAGRLVLVLRSAALICSKKASDEVENWQDKAKSLKVTIPKKVLTHVEKQCAVAITTIKTTTNYAGNRFLDDRNRGRRISRKTESVYYMTIL